MRDFPLFTTEHGAASLVFREIPYKGIAYITIQNTLQPEALLKDCVDFAVAAGADKIYAKGHEVLEKYPLHTAIWLMRRLREGLPETDAALFPVTEKTIENWRTIHNEKMMTVANAATLTKEDGKDILVKGSGYFVHRNGELLGIGSISEQMVESVIAVKPHAGSDVLLALCSAMFSEEINLEVASVNIPAVKLYEKLDFVKTAELARWYDVGK